MKTKHQITLGKIHSLWPAIICGIILNSQHLGAGSFFVDDFRDGNAQDGTPVRWTPNSRSVVGTFDASSGDYVFTPTPPQSGGFLIADALDFALSDTSIRVQGRVAGVNDSLIVEARNQSSTDSQHYSAGIGFFPDEGGTILFLTRADPGDGTMFFGGLPVQPFDIRQEDAIVQLDVIGNQLSLRAWRPGEPMPEHPQLSAQDNTYASGWVGIAGGAQGSTTFRYVRVSNSVLGPDLEISLNAAEEEGAPLLRWHGSEDDHVVLKADSPQGPWSLLAQPILNRDGVSWTDIAMAEDVQCYQLIRGHRFSDNFTGDVADAWATNFLGAHDWPSFVTMAAEDDQVRVTVAPQNEWKGAQGSIPYVRLMRPELVVQDVFMSLDILAWDHSKHPVCALIARQSAAGGAFAVFGFSAHSRSDPSRAILWSFNGHVVNAGIPFTIDPSQPYRLVLTAIEGMFTLQLFGLQSPAASILISSHSTVDDTLVAGPVGIYFGDDQSGPTGGFEMTVDNFVVLGTRGL